MHVQMCGMHVNRMGNYQKKNHEIMCKIQVILCKGWLECNYVLEIPDNLRGIREIAFFFTEYVAEAATN